MSTRVDLGELPKKRKKTSGRVGVDYVTPSKPDDLSLGGQCQRGVDFVLSHLEDPIFPRDIMTKQLGHKIEAFNRESLLSYFEDSDYQDCRISAYPRLTQYNGINLVPPSFIMIDLDHGNPDLKKTLDAIFKATLKRILHILSVKPTVLWTGNGYHIYLPIKAFILEEEEVFAKFQNGSSNEPSLSTKFIRFAESFFTDDKHDRQHRPSVNSCLLRVPGTYNSKNGQQVRIIQKWDGKKPAILYVLRDFRRYLIQKRLDEINEQKTHKGESVPSCCNNIIPTTILWIDALLQTPISDHRKYCTWRILAPYLVNSRKLSDEEALFIIMMWLEKCNTVERLTFNPRQRARYDIRYARKNGFYPISMNDLKTENTKLYDTDKE